MVRFQPPTAPAVPHDRPHRFAAPVDDDDEEKDDRLREEEEEEADADEDDESYEGKYDEEEEQEHSSVYPKLRDEDGQPLSRHRRAIPEDGDEAEGEDDDGRGASAMDVAAAPRNDQWQQQLVVQAAPSKKRFMADDADEESSAVEEAQPAPPSIPSYLLTHSALLTPGTHTAPSSDPAIALSSALSSLPPPPSSTLPSASPVPGVSDRAAGWRRAFRVGWGPDGRLAVVEGGKVTITQVRGDEQSKGRAKEAIERERKGRAEMRQRLLQVHLDFSEAQRSGSLQSNGQAPSEAQSSSSSSSSSSSFPALPVGRVAPLTASASPLALLCDRYTAALTPLLPSFPLPSSASSSSHTAFTFASQLRQAISCFQLVKLLFAPEYGSASLPSLLPGSPAPPPSSAPYESSSLSSSTSSYGERYARLQHLIRFLQDELSSPLHPPPRTQSPSFPSIFPLLSSFQIPQATEAALSANRLRLATLLPSLSAVSSSFTPLIVSQVSDWTNSGVWDVMDEDERRVWRLMAGDLQTDAMHWLRGLAMHAFYQEEGKGDVREAVRRYWRAVQAGKSRPPSPPYSTAEEKPPPKPRRRRIADDDEDDDAATNGEHALTAPSKAHQDTRFALLAVYAGLTTDLTGLFSPSSSTPDLLDHCLAFHLHHALTLSTLIPYSSHHHLLTSYASQLENDGQWNWAVYILHHSQHISRRHRIDIHHAHIAQLIIERHATAQPTPTPPLISPHPTHIALHLTTTPPPPSSPTQLFITAHTSTTPSTFHHAHALHASYSFDPLTALARYVDAAEWQAAHAVLVGGGVAAGWVLMGEWERLAEVLHRMTTHQHEVAGWREGGGVFLEFVRVRRAMEEGKGEEVTREKSSLMELTSKLMESSRAARKADSGGGDKVHSRSVESLLNASARSAMLDDCEQWRARHFP